jgi:YHS domain-containing protein
MIRTYVTSALVGAFALGLATAAIAAKGEFDNMCAQGLATGQKVETDCSVNATIKGKTYCFGNEQAKAEFMKNPDANLAKAQANYQSMKKPG